MKKYFIAVYDYGMGGVWFFLNARSAQEIEEKFPNLEVQEKFPTAFSNADIESVKKYFSFDVDHPPTDQYPVIFGSTLES
jgi:hypothetical protein